MSGGTVRRVYAGDTGEEGADRVQVCFVPGGRVVCQLQLKTCSGPWDEASRLAIRGRLFTLRIQLVKWCESFHKAEDESVHQLDLALVEFDGSPLSVERKAIAASELRELVNSCLERRQPTSGVFPASRSEVPQAG